MEPTNKKEIISAEAKLEKVVEKTLEKKGAAKAIKADAPSLTAEVKKIE